ncbi:outer membrane beta-barrel protein [Ottowia testudinis]|uniref:Porin family protein n=1 Tax=Ottowia testudinis TaxID=2816950 RepID=A0A975CH22_9BURK|nr:outer membrane beta-barrel protein [Ottowia testudinis]QTD45642.1 porin family protein [Ottowia testudinis]
MFSSKTAIGLTLALLCAAGAHAQSAATPTSGVYTELGFTALRYKDNATGAGLPAFKGNATMVRGIAGYNLNENLALEGMVGFGVSGKKSTIGGEVFHAKPSNMVGLFIKPKLPLGDSAELFGRVGFSSVKFGGDPGRSNGLAWGLGGAYRLTPAVALTADYMRYYSKSGQSLGGMTVGVNYRF